MAARSKQKQTVVETPEPVIPVVEKKPGWMKWAGVAVVAVAALLFWWWRTGTWPIVAMVGMKPVTRYEVMKSLYAQGGATLVDNLITQRQIENELDRLGVQVDQKAVDDQINAAKKQLPAGQNFETELAKQGLDLAAVRNLISLQLRLAKVSKDKVSVTPTEVDDYIKANSQYLTATTEAGKKDEAQAAVLQQKESDAISKWVEAVRAKTKVWRAPGI